MNVIPIAFSFDDNFILPAGVCISSLLENALPTTFYDIFILHDEGAKFPEENIFEILFDKYVNFKITYRCVGTPFLKAFEIRGITISTYYRLLIPEFVPEYDIIMYHDVDVIFRSDLSSFYLNTNMEGYYLAGVLSNVNISKKSQIYYEKIGVNSDEYINAGNLIVNSKKILEDNLVESFKNLIKNKYLHQDQDIINISCKGKIKFLPPTFVGTISMYKAAVDNSIQDVFSKNELEDLLSSGNIHYNGPKPWNEYCPNFDIWWDNYRKSVFYDPKFYFKFYYEKVGYLDTLPLIKRVKILIRYFLKGVIKAEI